MRCQNHPEYTGDTPPTGFPCSVCSIIWVTRQAERYARAEFRIMKRTIIGIAVLGAFALGQTTTTNWIYGGIGGVKQWFVMGNGFRIVPVPGSYPRLDVVSVAPTPKEAKLVYDATLKSWSVPSTAKRIELYDFGIRYWEGSDYTWDRASNRVTALSDNLIPEHDVRIVFYE